MLSALLVSAAGPNDGPLPSTPLTTYAALPASSAALLAPAVVLLLWTLLVEVYLYSVRIPALMRLQRSKKFEFDPAKHTKVDWHKAMPNTDRFASDNFTHLHEQPTAFYAVVALLALLGAGSADNVVTVRLAWTYSILRIVHSVWQCTINNIPVRFGLFIASSAVLAALTVRAAALTLF
jgi:hypothetical protein